MQRGRFKKRLPIISCAALFTIVLCFCVLASIITGDKMPTSATATYRADLRATEARAIEVPILQPGDTPSPIPTNPEPTGEPRTATAITPMPTAIPPTLTQAPSATRTAAPTRALPTWTARPLATWTARPSPYPAQPTATAAKVIVPTSPPPAAAPCNCAVSDYNCTDFSTHRAAQACWEFCGGNRTNNLWGLDSDKDGIACESLP